MKFTKNKSKSLLIVTASIALFSSPAYADWGVGINANNDIMKYKDGDDKDSNLRLEALLNLQYRGDKFNIDKGLSYDFTNSNKYAVEAFITAKNRGFVAKDNKTFIGMSDRKTSIDVGGRVIADTGVIGPVVIDVTKDVHASKGYEANIKLGGIAPHAPHWTGKRSFTLAGVANLRYQSADVVDYYYGVKNSEATATRSSYKAKSAITPYVGIEAQANITPHFTIDGGIGVAKRAKSIRNSSLTNDKKYDPSINLGFTYWF